MRYIHFNDGWFCKHLDEAEEALPVSVPDDAMLREPRTATSMGDFVWAGTDYLGELILNGKSLGKKTPKNDCLVKFRVPYENGVLEAISYGEGDNANIHP